MQLSHKKKKKNQIQFLYCSQKGMKHAVIIGNEIVTVIKPVVSSVIQGSTVVDIPHVSIQSNLINIQDKRVKTNFNEYQFIALLTKQSKFKIKNEHYNKEFYNIPIGKLTNESVTTFINPPAFRKVDQSSTIIRDYFEKLNLMTSITSSQLNQELIYKAYQSQLYNLMNYNEMHAIRKLDSGDDINLSNYYQILSVNKDTVIVNAVNKWIAKDSCVCGNLISRINNTQFNECLVLILEGDKIYEFFKEFDKRLEFKLNNEEHSELLIKRKNSTFFLTETDENLKNEITNKEFLDNYLNISKDIDFIGDSKIFKLVKETGIEVADEMGIDF